MKTEIYPEVNEENPLTELEKALVSELNDRCYQVMWELTNERDHCNCGQLSSTHVLFSQSKSLSRFGSVAAYGYDEVAQQIYYGYEHRFTTTKYVRIISRFLMPYLG